MARLPAKLVNLVWPISLAVSPRARMLSILGVVALLAGLNQTLFHDVAALLRETRHLLNEDLDVAGEASDVAFLVTLPLGGFFAYLLGPRRTLLGAGLMMSLAGLGMAFAFDARSYAVLCLLLGLAAGLVPGAVVTAIGFWFAPQEQAWAIAAVQAAPVIGGLIATIMMANRTGQWAGHRFSDYWQTIYLGIALLAVAWLVLATMFYRPRPRIPGIDPDQVENDLPVGELWPLGVVLRGGALAALAFCQTYAICLGGAWLDTRLFERWHLATAEVPFVVISGLVGKCAGLLLGGFLSDLAFHHSGNVKSARQVVIGLGFILGALALLPLLHLHDLAASGIWRGASFFFLAMTSAPLWSIALTIAPGRSGPVLGMLGLGTSLGLYASPTLLASLAGAHGWDISFWTGVSLCLVCGIGAFALDPSLEIEKPPPKPIEEAEAAGH